MSNDNSTPIADFDWSSLENTQTIESKPGEKILSTEPYAQELYDVYKAHFEGRELVEPSKGSIVSGSVVRKTEDYAEVNINWRESAYIDLTREDNELTKYIQEGAAIDLYIKNINKKNLNTYNIMGSYSEVVRAQKLQEIKDGIGESVAFMAKVKSLVYGGYFLDIDGIEVFMPGSQGGMNKLVNFEELLGKSIYVCPINFDKQKNYIVVSHRAYLKTLVPTCAEKLSTGDEKEGFVTGSSKFGVFVEFDDCLTGLIHKSDLENGDNDKYSNGSIKPGDKISFKIKEVVDPFRIVLTQKEIVYEADPWDDIEKRYKAPSRVEGKVKKIARFGMFIELEPKVSGLLHKSEYEDLGLDFKPGDSITVDLYKIEKETKKLYFSL